MARGGRCVSALAPAASPPCLSLPQARPWWPWSPATGRLRGAAPAPPGTTGARTAAAAAATPSARPASAPGSRVRAGVPRLAALPKPCKYPQAKAASQTASLSHDTLRDQGALEEAEGSLGTDCRLCASGGM